MNGTDRVALLRATPHPSADGPSPQRDVRGLEGDDGFTKPGQSCSTATIKLGDVPAWDTIIWPFYVFTGARRDDPSIDTTSRTGKLVMGILALIAEFENDIRRERQMDGIAKATWIGA